MAELSSRKSGDEAKKATNDSFKFNAQAPEFVPTGCSQMTTTQVNMSDLWCRYHPWFQLPEVGGPEWFQYFGMPEVGQFFPKTGASSTSQGSKGFHNNDLKQKILKQVEYQFSDASLIANDSFMKLVNKDPDGYVPISYVASSKKIKPLITGNQMLANTLRGSSKLVVSEDGKKVKRKIVLSERHKEELQSRMVVVENLPEDYSHQNMQKIFSVAGRVKSVRICHPQGSNNSKSNKDILVSNKLHAFVEFEFVEQAERAVEKLNDERNWRKGLRVRLLQLRRTPRSVIRTRNYDHFDISCEDDDSTPRSKATTESPHATEPNTENNNTEVTLTPTSSSKKSAWPQGWGKARPWISNHGGRGVLAASPQPPSPSQCEAGGKNSPKCRMEPRDSQWAEVSRWSHQTSKHCPILIKSKTSSRSVRHQPAHEPNLCIPWG